MKTGRQIDRQERQTDRQTIVSNLMSEFLLFHVANIPEPKAGQKIYKINNLQTATTDCGSSA